MSFYYKKGILAYFTSLTKQFLTLCLEFIVSHSIYDKILII